MKKTIPLVLLFILSSCSYTFNLSVLSNYSSAHIPLGNNNTTKVGLSETVSEALKNQLASRHNFDFVNNPSHADLILEYSIDSHSETPVSFTADDIVTSNRINLSISFTLARRQGQVIAEETISAEALYNPQTETEAQGLQRAVDNAIERFFRNVDNRW